MRRLVGRFFWVAAAAWGTASVARAESAGLRFIPKEAELVVVVPQPARIYTIVDTHPIRKELYKHEVVQALYDTGNFRRLEQLIAYFEKKLGRSRDEILQQLTAKGATIGAKLSSNQSAVLVLESANESLLRTFIAETLTVVNEELARQESKARFRKSSHGRIETIHLGDKLHFAQVGPFLVAATELKLLHRAIDLHADAAPMPAGSILTRMPRKDRAKEVLAWSWLDFEGVQRNKEFQEGLKAATTDGFLKLLAGGFLDVLKRTPSLEFEIRQEGKNFRVTFAMARGAEGMSEVAKTYVATEAKRVNPPLQPPRVVSSTSWTFDIGHIWKNRKAWLGEEAAKGLTKLEKDIKPFLGGADLGELLHEAGWNQRIVFAEQAVSPYKIKPELHITPFGVVFDIREKRFAQTMGKALRAGALFGTFQFGMRMTEEECKGYTLVTYHFDEKRKSPIDPTNIRFNFSPTFGQVGNHFIVASTTELARDLVNCLARKDSPLPAGTSWRTDLFAKGLADNLKYIRQDLLVGAILDQGLPPADANKEIDSLIELVRTLGTVQWEIRYGDHDYRMDFLWRYGSK